MLNALADTPAARGAVEQAVAALKYALDLMVGDRNMQTHPFAARGDVCSRAPASIFEESGAGLAYRLAPAADRAAGSPVVFVVDDDTDVRLALDDLILAKGWRRQGFASVGAFLSEPPPTGPHCLLLDMNQAGIDGREVRLQMAARGRCMPVILLTDYDAIPPALRTIRNGAPEFLIKPVDEAALYGAVERAIARSAEILRCEADLHELRRRYASLSQREREVMDLVTVGLLNKQVGGRLGISEITVKAHRGQVMHKMHAGSFADLVTMGLWLRSAALAD